MSWLKQFLGTTKNKFGLGGPNGVNLNNNSGTAEVLDSTGENFAPIRAKRLSSSDGLNNVPTRVDLLGLVADIRFSFAGVDAPEPGTNEGKFGICHTAGGGFTAGTVVYDDGETELLNFTLPFANHITTTTTVSGDVVLAEQSLYVKQSGASNGGWVRKCSGLPSGWKTFTAAATAEQGEGVVTLTADNNAFVMPSGKFWTMYVSISTRYTNNGQVDSALYMATYRNVAGTVTKVGATEIENHTEGDNVIAFAVDSGTDSVTITVDPGEPSGPAILSVINATIILFEM